MGVISNKLENFLCDATESQLNAALHMLQDQRNQLFIQAHTHHIADWAYALIYFNEIEVLNDVLRHAMVDYTAPVYLVTLFKVLNMAECLNVENQLKVIGYPMPFLLTPAVINLQQEGILNDATLASLVSHERPHILAEQVIVLHRAGILNESF